MKELLIAMMDRHRAYPSNYIVIYLEHNHKFTAYKLSMLNPHIVKAQSGNLTCYFPVNKLVGFEMMEQTSEQKDNSN